MRTYNVAPQEGFPMRVFHATLIVVLTLAGIVIFWPLILLGIVSLIGSGWGIFVLIIAPFAVWAGWSEAAEKQRRANRGIVRIKR